MPVQFFKTLCRQSQGHRSRLRFGGSADYVQNGELVDPRRCSAGILFVWLTLPASAFGLEDALPGGLNAKSARRELKN
jgi:hypothetical protein